MRRPVYVLLILLFLLTACGNAASAKPPTGTTVSSTSTAVPATHPVGTVLPTSSIAGLDLPAGFQISVYADQLENPRLIAVGPQGVLLVANRSANNIIALWPGSSLTQAGKRQTLISDLNDPTSLDIADGYLYIGEQTSIARVKLNDDLSVGPVERIIPDLPDGGQHSTRTVLIGPDKHIYVAIGSTCNVCVESDSHRAAIWVYDMDGSNGRLYARGLRNAVGLAINPWNQQIWATNNGRDLLGDDVPPETLYALVDQGDYGWPHCHAGTIPDPEYGQGASSCNGVQQPLLRMQAHSAPLGLAFYPPNARQFPQDYQNSLYIAFHGSWNRTKPTGYKVVRVSLKNGQVTGQAEDFLSGWLGSDGKASGRPVGITFAPDGSMYVSDDGSGKIYHIWYQA